MFELTDALEKTADEIQGRKTLTAIELRAYEDKQRELSSHLKNYRDLSK